MRRWEKEAIEKSDKSLPKRRKIIGPIYIQKGNMNIFSAIIQDSKYCFEIKKLLKMTKHDIWISLIKYFCTLVQRVILLIFMKITFRPPKHLDHSNLETKIYFLYRTKKVDISLYNKCSNFIVCHFSIKISMACLSWIGLKVHSVFFFTLV